MQAELAMNMSSLTIIVQHEDYSSDVDLSGGISCKHERSVGALRNHRAFHQRI
jgi:hypothetical protein